eukprot:scaffold203_cov386-Prasinococcus_capsulatus_cf.AAC.15
MLWYTREKLEPITVMGSEIVRMPNSAVIIPSSLPYHLVGAMSPTGCGAMIRLRWMCGEPSHNYGKEREPRRGGGGAP